MPFKKGHKGYIPKEKYKEIVKKRSETIKKRGYWFSPEASKKIVKNLGDGMLGKKHSTETKEKMRQARLKNPIGWKGDNASPKSFHRWLNRNIGKASEFQCKCKKPAKHWANIKNHNYTRNPKDYIAMCVSCHMKFDYKQRRLSK